MEELPMKGPETPNDDAIKLLNSYRSAIQQGAHFITEQLPPPVVGLCHADLAAFILANELGAPAAAKKFDELANALRADAKATVLQ